MTPKKTNLDTFSLRRTFLVKKRGSFYCFQQRKSGRDKTRLKISPPDPIFATFRGGVMFKISKKKGGFWGVFGPKTGPGTGFWGF